MSKLAIFAFLAVSLAGAACSDDAPPGCRIVASPTLPASPLTLAREAQLLRAGDAFVLAAVDGERVRWARLSPEGALDKETSFKLPANLALGPFLGAVGKDAPGDQLVAVVMVPKSGGGFEVQSLVQNLGAAVDASEAPKRLFEALAGTDPRAVRMALGTSRAGRRALLSWGIEGQAGSPSFILLGANGEAVPGAPGMPAAVYGRAGGAVPRWSCLATPPARTDFGVSVLEAPAAANGKPSWHMFELKEDGSRGFEQQLFFDVPTVNCPVASAPTGKGYVLSYQNPDGTFFTDFDVEKEVPNSDIIAGAVRFGGPAKQPRVAGIAPMGKDFGLLFDRPSGPEVWRIDVFGDPKGRSLYLPATRANVGPVSFWPASDAFFVTYLDIVEGTRGTSPTDGNPIGNQRYLIKVDCPAQ